ncbi:SDR family oxidoreductase [Streptomyces sp. NPDC005820]|uniref:SDR family NAD(P)-dependent oxidoreductase n=1 Tax=Streptomyces sp. NPDC005820 TaxID=3157069 RepID=UPI0033D893B8
MRAAVIGVGGIGTEVVRALRSRGHEVVAGWHSSPQAAERLGVPGAAIDARDPDSCREFLAWVWRTQGPCAAVVNCFGTVAEGPLLKTDAKAVEQILDANLLGVVNVCRAVAFRLMKAGGGSIVNIGSAASRLGVPGLSGYTAAKSALAGFGRALAAEFARYQVTCNTVSPGFVDCGGTAQRPEAWKAAVARHIPLGRLGTAADVAALAAHLASPESRYITGQEFVVDGGWTLGSPVLAADLTEADRA